MLQERVHGVVIGRRGDHVEAVFGLSSVVFLMLFFAVIQIRKEMFGEAA